MSYQKSQYPNLDGRTACAFRPIDVGDSPLILSSQGIDDETIERPKMRKYRWKHFFPKSGRIVIWIGLDQKMMCSGLNYGLKHPRYP